MTPESEEAPSPRKKGSRSRTPRRIAHYTVVLVTIAAPLAIGGARPFVQVVLSAAALVAGGAWLVSRRGEAKLPPFAGIALLALGFTLLQLLPLPAALVELISPRALQIRTDALGARPSFLPLTLDVPATLLAAARGVACLAVLIVGASAVRRGKQHLLVLPIVFLGAFIAVLSFVQRGLGAETILGFYRVTDMPGSGFFGTFVSGNHAASFFTIAALLGLGCARDSDGHLRAVLGAASLICVAAVFSTLSRFGIVGLAAGGFAMLTAWLVNRLGGIRGLIAAVGIGVIGAPLAVSLALAQRGGSGALPLNDFKFRGWDDALELAVNFPLVGVGRGAFEAPATAFRDNPEGVRLVFPENILLQFATEWGFPVTLLLIGVAIWRAIPILRRLPNWEPIPLAAACAVIGTLVHDLADFSLEALGVAMPFALALGVVSGRRQTSLDGVRSSSTSAEKPATPARPAHPGLANALATIAFAASALVVVGAAWASEHTSDADARRARQLMAVSSPQTEPELARAIARHPSDYDFALLAARAALRQNPPSPAALRQLNRAQRLYPMSAAPHILTAHVLVRLRRPTQAAIELRLADELGGGLSYERIEKLVGPAQLERAIPRTPERLFDLAMYLAARDRAAEAAAASARAVMFSEASEVSLIRRLQIALRSGSKPFIGQAAGELARSPVSPEAFELAIKGLAAAGDVEGARELIRKAGAAMPDQGSVVVNGARAIMDSGDLNVARSIITEGAIRDLPIHDRIASEQLLAEIAEKEGDSHAAAAARARARILIGMRERHAGP
ncbi:MAG TPA: O-antigen ligase family protein [Polyangia bacterium]